MSDAGIVCGERESEESKSVAGGRIFVGMTEKCNVARDCIDCTHGVIVRRDGGVGWSSSSVQTGRGAVLERRPTKDRT